MKKEMKKNLIPGLPTSCLVENLSSVRIEYSAPVGCSMRGELESGPTGKKIHEVLCQNKCMWHV